MKATGPHKDQPLVTAGAPLDASRCAVIMVHGRGASPQNILELVPLLGRSEFAYLAPAAANNTWYPHSFLTEIPKNEPWLSSALEVLADVVEHAGGHGIGRDRIVLLGFSQGACLCGEFAVRSASRFGGILMLSGGLIGPPGTRWDYGGSFDGTPVFFGCSDSDAHIPAARVDESAKVFERMGALVTKRLYPGMGHLVNEDEIVAARQVLDLVLQTLE
jgi:predicted esterase